MAARKKTDDSVSQDTTPGVLVTPSQSYFLVVTNTVLAQLKPFVAALRATYQKVSVQAKNTQVDHNAHEVVIVASSQDMEQLGAVVEKLNSYITFLTKPRG